jgi:hypothetical protein
VTDQRARRWGHFSTPFPSVVNSIDSIAQQTQNEKISPTHHQPPRQKEEEEKDQETPEQQTTALFGSTRHEQS